MTGRAVMLARRARSWYRARRAWQQAATLADLGELVARWLTGTAPYNPGYGGAGGPDPETADLAPVLARINRAGTVVTIQSQPGLDVTDTRGWTWRQRAAAALLTDPATAARITRAADKAGLRTHATGGPGATGSAAAGQDGVLVTILNGQPYTHVGAGPAQLDLALLFPGCRRARRAVATAVRVAVIDPAWGRDELLWPVLERAVAGDCHTRPRSRSEELR